MVRACAPYIACVVLIFTAPFFGAVARADPLWVKGVGSTGFDQPRDMVIDSDGNIIVVGSFQDIVDFGGRPISASGFDDVFLAKYDSSGNHLWSRGFGGQGIDIGFGVAVDASGAIVITGAFEFQVDFGGGILFSIGDDDIFIAKYNGEGQHIWSKSIGAFNSDAGTGVGFDPSGNIFVTGQYTSAVNFGGGPVLPFGESDIFLLKLNSDGNHIWSKGVGGLVSDFSNGLAVDSSGNVLITGSFGGSVDFGGGPVSAGDLFDIFVAKYSDTGTHIWSKGFGGAGTDIGMGIAVDITSPIITGTFSQSVDFGGGPIVSKGLGDVFVTRLRSFDGGHFWSHGFGSPGNDVGWKVTFDPFYHDVLVTGEISGVTDIYQDHLGFSGGASDFFAARFDAIGRYVWSVAAGGAGDDRGSAVGVDDDGNVLIAGEYQETVDFGGISLTSAGFTDIFIAKIRPVPPGPLPLLWAFSAGGISNDVGTDIATDAEGNVIVAGHFTDLVDFGGGTEERINRTTRPFVAKYDSAGNYLWFRSLEIDDTSDFFQIRGLAMDPSGDIVVTGVSRAFFPREFVGPDIFVTKLGSAGNLIWSKIFDGREFQIGLSVDIDSHSNIFVTGSALGEVDLGGDIITSSGDSDIFILKLNGNGDHLWARGFGSALRDQGWEIAVDSRDNAIVSGTFTDTIDLGGGEIVSGGGKKTYLAKFAGDGTHIWSQGIGGDPGGFPGESLHRSITINSADHIIMSGSAEGDVDFGGGVIAHGSDIDLFLASYDGDGAHVWSRVFGRDGIQVVNDIAVDPLTGTILTTGQIPNGLDFLSGVSSLEGSPIKYFSAGFKGGGNILWSVDAVSPQGAGGLGIATDPFGNILVTDPVPQS